MAYQRYLLVSLIVLCAVALSGAALAADSWAVDSAPIPTSLQWDQAAPTVVGVINDGTTIWDDTFSLDSVLGTEVINRWGLGSVSVMGTVDPLDTTDGDPSGAYSFGVPLVAPPITTLTYPTPVGVSPGVIAGLSNDWVMANAGGFITTDAIDADTVVLRMKDIHEGDAAHDKFAFEIEEMAGRVPVITTGFADGTYRPTQNVRRDQMAQFIQRALELPLAAYRPDFSDVASTDGAAGSILACVDAGIVKGFNDGTYRPGDSVTRRQMATFLARGMAGGDEFVITPAGTPTFSDVPDTDSGYKYIEYAVDHGATTGYADGTFRPTGLVTRGQMAAFLYRSFIQPTGAIVVLAGPALTEVDPATADYDGWTSASFVGSGGSVNAYVGFDAVRFGATQADFDVTFSLYDAVDIDADGDPITGATAAVEQSVSVDVAAARAAALAGTGNPYTYAAANLSGMADGSYTLLTTVNGVLLKREPSLSVGTSPAVGGSFNAPYIAAVQWDMLSATSVTAGSDAALAASDDDYLVLSRTAFPDDADWCDNGNYGKALVWTGVPTDAATLDLTIEYHVENTDGDWGPCCDTSCCDQWGTLDPAWSLTDPGTPVHTPVYTWDTDGDDTSNHTSPLGWGFSVYTGDFDGGFNWWDTDGMDKDADGDDDFWLLQGSGDPMVPSPRDVVGGGDVYPSQGFTGFARDTDVVEHWGTTNGAGFVDANGNFVVMFCGGSIQNLYIDQAVLTYTK